MNTTRATTILLAVAEAIREDRPLDAQDAADLTEILDWLKTR